MTLHALNVPFVWAILGLIVLLHFCAFALRSKKAVGLLLTAVNFALHIALICVMLYLRAAPEELFFAMLLSAAAGLFATAPKKKGGGGDGI